MGCPALAQRRRGTAIAPLGERWSARYPNPQDEAERLQALEDKGGADEPRDLNLTPRLIDWIETHYDLYRLRRDYPHWEDAKGGWAD